MGLLDTIQGFEGFTPRATWDYAQWSNGYGTKAAYPGEVIDRATALNRLKAEVGTARSQVQQRFPNLSPEQAEPVASFTYNVGPGWMGKPTRLASSLDTGDMRGAANAMQAYNKAKGTVLPGLVYRRAAEGKMLLGASQVPSSGPEDVGPNGLQPLHPEIYATASAPATPSSPGPRPMDLPSLPAQPPGLLSRLGVDRPGWLDDVKTTLNTPLAQQGLGLFFAGMSGHDPNAGMTAGAQRASTMTNDLLHRMQVERTLQRQAIADNLVRNLPNNPALAGSLPKEVIAGISALPPDVAADVYGKGILARQQADINNKAAASQRQQMVDTLLAFRKQMEDEAKRGPRPTPQGAPAGGQWAPDGNYYVPNPQAPGKYLMWKD